MNIDLNLTITGIIALCAILSPVFTTLINNHHQTKIKKIEIYETAKQQALYEYISASFNYISFKSTENEVKFFTTLNNLYIYFPKIDKMKYDDLSKAVRSLNAETYSFYSQEIFKNLSKHIKKT